MKPCIGLAKSFSIKKNQTIHFKKKKLNLDIKKRFIKIYYLHSKNGCELWSMNEMENTVLKAFEM